MTAEVAQNQRHVEAGVERRGQERLQPDRGHGLGHEIAEAQRDRRLQEELERTAQRMRMRVAAPCAT